jgi:predicted acyltransferase
MNKERFLSLDVFRGMTICLMIIVNTPGDSLHTFAPFRHASWHGFTPTDLVFPSFLFAVGNSLSFVLPNLEKSGTPSVLFTIFKRTLILFTLGFLMYWFPFTGALQDARIFGVLQRIALAYGFAALIAHFMHERVVKVLTAVLLLTYWHLAVRYGQAGDPFSLTGNAVLRLDLYLLGPSHLYHGEGIAFDPEGLLSTLPAIVNVLVGFIIGNFIKASGKTYEGLTHLFMWGAGFVFLAFMWHYQFPINKKLWTSSFVVLTIGINMIILATIIYRVDIHRQHQFSRFFEIFGKNALVIYLFSEILLTTLNLVQGPSGHTSAFDWLYQQGFANFDPYWGSLFFAISYMLLCWSMGYVLDKYKIYIRI